MSSTKGGGGGGGVVAKSCLTLATPWTVPTRLLCPWDSPGKNTGVSCHFLLQGIFPTQESNPDDLPTEHNPQSARSGLREAHLYQPTSCEALGPCHSLAGGKSSFLRINWLMEPLNSYCVLFVTFYLPWVAEISQRLFTIGCKNLSAS